MTTAQSVVRLSAVRLAAPAAPFVVIMALIFALQFGPLISLLGFHWTGDQNWVLGGAVRDAGVLLMAALAAISWLTARTHARLPRSAHWAMTMVLVYAALALVSGTSIMVLALNMRRLALAPLLFLSLLMIPWSASQINRIFRWMVLTSVVVAVFGIVERVLPETFWTTWMDLDSYTSANGFDRFGGLSFSESGRYYSWDLDRWTGAPVRRMISTYLEPTTLAAAMAVLLVMGMARVARGHAATGLVVLAGLCGIATVSKGFALFLLALLAWRTVGLPSPKHLLVLTAAACVVALLAGQLHLEGPLEHVAGLDTGLRHLAAGHWLGQGIGEAGNYTNADGGVGEESGMGNVMGQAGIAALLPVLWVAAMARDVLRAGQLRRDPGAPWVAAWLLFWTVTYLFSASSLAVGGNALGFALLALYLHPATGPSKSKAP
jgi:hypothetical protein